MPFCQEPSPPWLFAVGVGSAQHSTASIGLCLISADEPTWEVR